MESPQEKTNLAEITLLFLYKSQNSWANYLENLRRAANSVNCTWSAIASIFARVEVRHSLVCVQVKLWFLFSIKDDHEFILWNYATVYLFFFLCRTSQTYSGKISFPILEFIFFISPRKSVRCLCRNPGTKRINGWRNGCKIYSDLGPLDLFQQNLH